jgi:hypothetical protein
MNFNRRFKNPSAPSPPKRLPALVFFQPPLQIRARPTGRQSLQIRDRPRLVRDRICQFRATNLDVFRDSLQIGPGQRLLRALAQMGLNPGGVDGCDHFIGCAPAIRISTSPRALCCQSGPAETLATPTIARRRSIGSQVLTYVDALDRPVHQAREALHESERRTFRTHSFGSFT